MFSFKSFIVANTEKRSETGVIIMSLLKEASNPCWSKDKKKAHPTQVLLLRNNCLSDFFDEIYPIQVETNC